MEEGWGQLCSSMHKTKKNLAKCPGIYNCLIMCSITVVIDLKYIPASESQITNTDI